MDVIITIGAVSAVVGIVQFGIFKFDHLGQRPRGVLGLYMTYSGQLMLVACMATARILFRQNDRIWAALVMPALIAALVTTLTRSAWIGACAGIGLLFIIRDLRFVALLPVVAALFMAFGPTQLTERLYSSFRLDKLRHDSAETQAGVQSNQDRLFMLKSGLRIIKDHPLTGVGPDMVREVYPQYREPGALNQLNPHLHNVPMQIAAERGLPALATLAVVRLRAAARFHRQAEDDGDPVARDGGVSPRSWPCWRPGCSNTTSATPSSSCSSSSS